MSSSPPPGWYSDPSYPLTERWWDGTAWTDHRRQPEQLRQPVGPPRPPTRKGPGRTKVVVLAAAGAVLVAGAVTGGVLLLGEDGDGGQETRTATASPTTGADGSDSPSPSKSSSKPSDDASTAVDDLNGITFPILDGWIDGDGSAEDDAVLVTDGIYDCPGDDGLCRAGTVVSRTVTGSDETSPKALAENDIEDAANDAYDRDTLDRRPYNGITGHEVVDSGSVAVAGRAGYFVRWRVTTGAGPGGYVQSLVFPSSSGSEAPVLVRFAIDAGDDGPPVGDIDTIVKGIRPVGDAGTGGGVGSSLGPS
ncbi:DUF2510 domain-containing protein [Streptomyces adelaidensis]|uniref:DUF2510 domain-containing protein n=1 Tax=Streptomyces adelaidensis TaxID=2796465 RepID=UPI0019042753|nr:DUF2510 domain-containing protein [Streptomyces adelaidensis]